MRPLAISSLLLASVSLGACATAWKPPQISYDNTPKPAVLQAEPPKPIQIVEVPKIEYRRRSDWRLQNAQAAAKSPCKSCR